MNKILIIPTYNEIENINVLYKKIRKFNKDLKILFIDDNSPDGTINEIKKLKKKDKKILFLLRKKKSGIGSAHKAGIKWAINNKVTFCITMDSDLTHDPKLISQMLKHAPKYHLVQTNRFMHKNSMASWPIYRRILTWMRYFLLRILLNIKYDSSGAFRCYNFKKMNPNLIFCAKNNSYSFFWETMYIFVKEQYLVKELKMIQNYRKSGDSKIQFKDWIHGFYYLFVIYFRDLLNISYKKL